MHKETAPPFQGGELVENGAGLTLRRLPGDLIVCVCGVGKVNAALAALNRALADRKCVVLRKSVNAGVEVRRARKIV